MEKSKRIRIAVLAWLLLIWGPLSFIFDIPGKLENAKAWGKIFKTMIHYATTWLPSATGLLVLVFLYWSWIRKSVLGRGFETDLTTKIIRDIYRENKSTD